MSYLLPTFLSGLLRSLRSLRAPIVRRGEGVWSERTEIRPEIQVPFVPSSHSLPCLYAREPFFHLPPSTYVPSGPAGGRVDGGEGDTNGEGTEGRADLFPVHLSPSGLRSPVMLGPSFRSLSRLSLTRFFGPSFVHSVRHERKERSVAE